MSEEERDGNLILYKLPAAWPVKRDSLIHKWEPPSPWEHGY